MSNDDDFEPHLGRQRGQVGRRPARYAGRITVLAGLNATKPGTSRRRFDGSRIGRGAAIGTLLASRSGQGSGSVRRVIVKTRLARLHGKHFAAARAHLHYIQRDGVSREGEPGQLYGPDADKVDGKAFLERAQGDRHQFRFIVSAEDGDRYADLKPFVRRLMSEAERDLDTKLDWVAVDHFNTGHPHSHIVLRGVDEKGHNLVIAREYISHGLRERAGEIVTRDLGPRTSLEIEERLRREVTQERLTQIDRRMLERMGADRAVSPDGSSPFFRALETGRLESLRRMDLAEALPAGGWRLAEGLEDTLRRMGERGDIIRLMQRELTRAKLDRHEHQIYAAHSPELVGRIVQRGLADEHRDRHYLLVDGADGRTHYVDIGNASAVEPIPHGSTIRITPRAGQVRDFDRTVLAVASANNGRYSIALHQTHDTSASRVFAEAHVRRLEAMRRSGAELSRDPDGTWLISTDHIAAVEKFEALQLHRRPVAVEILASQPLDRLARIEAATWLDRELSAPRLPPVRDGGFGREVRTALDVRRQWLIDQDLAEAGPQGISPRKNMMAILQRRELLRIAGELSQELEKGFVEAKPGDWIEGKISRRIDAVSGRFAIVEKSREFTLVPWRPVLENRIGKQAGGLMREAGINWDFGRGRTGPEIS